MPFFTNVKSIETIKDVAEFGSKLIKTGENDNVLASVIKKFYKKIIKEIAEPSCYNFFLDCLGCSRVVILVGKV